VAGSSFAPEADDALRSAKQIYVGTRRKDGMPSAVVPVWFMFDGEAIYFTTGPESHKARRIARGSPLLVWVGRRDGPHFEGRAAPAAQDGQVGRLPVARGVTDERLDVTGRRDRLGGDVLALRDRLDGRAKQGREPGRWRPTPQPRGRLRPALLRARHALIDRR